MVKLKNFIKNLIDNVLRLLPYTKTVMLYKTDFKPPGHFYSPIPSISEVVDSQKRIYQADKNFPGIEMNEDRQFALLQELSKYYSQVPFQDNAVPGQRYYFNNTPFSYSDAITTYSMMRHFGPRKMIEVGSGYSSALILDTNDQFFDGSIDLTFIEPYPERLKSLMFDQDLEKESINVFPNIVQEVEIDYFKQLEKDDILFIDSSHVAKIGSDVCFLIFEVLPALQSGVIIHFHDIFNPFEYPIGWVKEGRAWNEAYVLRAFLQYNSDFEIVFFSSFMEDHHEEWYDENMPLCLKYHEVRKDPSGKQYFLPLKGQGIWIRKR